MGLALPKANTGAGAPPVEDGLCLLRFDDLVLKEHEDWATDSDKFGKPDDGQRYHFQFTLLDEDRSVVYHEGDPIELEALTRTATGSKSNFAAILEGILTPQEFALWQADQPFDDSTLRGRIVNGKVAHNKSGWPFVESVIGIAKDKKGKG